MLRGTLVLFAGFFTVLILRRTLYIHHWLGMVLIVAGAALVGAASIMYAPGSHHHAAAPPPVPGLVSSASHADVWSGDHSDVPVLLRGLPLVMGSDRHSGTAGAAQQAVAGGDEQQRHHMQQLADVMSVEGLEGSLGDAAQQMINHPRVLLGIQVGTVAGCSWGNGCVRGGSKAGGMTSDQA